MAEKLVLVGVIPEVIVIGPRDQVEWLSDAGNLKVEFDPNRCPFLECLPGARWGEYQERPAAAGGKCRLVQIPHLPE
jgi:hypothetical protein